MLARIQNDLFDLGADLCAPEDGRKAEGRLRIVDSQVERLEREIDAMNAELSPLTSFVLPGGTAAAAHLHLARTIVPARRTVDGGTGGKRKWSALRRCATPTGCRIICSWRPRIANDAGAGMCYGFRGRTGEREVLWVHPAG